MIQYLYVNGKIISVGTLPEMEERECRRIMKEVISGMIYSKHCKNDVNVTMA
jgi:hypothetical protein